MGGAVQDSAVGFHRGHVHALGGVSRAFEHHVLEEMGEAGASLFFGTRADVVEHVYGHHGDGGIAGEDHPQPVRQRIPFHGNIDIGRAKAERGRNERNYTLQGFHNGMLVLRLAPGDMTPGR